MNENNENIYCKNCGELISKTDKFCPQCGVSVSTTKTNKKEKKEFKNDQPSTKMKSHSVEQGNKKISGVKIFYLTFILIVVGLLIVYSSGIFDKPPVSASTQNVNNNPHSGVDLKYLQRINQLEEELKTQPDNDKLIELAHLLNDSGFKDKAIEKYLSYLKQNPKDADVLVDLGVCYYELGKNEDAIRYMKEALKYQPKHQIAHLNIGIVSLASNKHDEAIQWWKKAVEINPGSEIGKRAQELINSH